MAGADRVGSADGPGWRVSDARVRQHVRREHLGRARLRRAVRGHRRTMEFVGPGGRVGAVRYRDGVAIRIAGARHRRSVPAISRAPLCADAGGTGRLWRTGGGAERAWRTVSPAVSTQIPHLRAMM